MSDACPVEQKVRGAASPTSSETSSPQAKPKAKAKVNQRQESFRNKVEKAKQQALLAQGMQMCQRLWLIQLASLRVEPRLRAVRKMYPDAKFGLVDGGASHRPRQMNGRREVPFP